MKTSIYLFRSIQCMESIRSKEYIKVLDVCVVSLLLRSNESYPLRGDPSNKNKTRMSRFVTKEETSWEEIKDSAFEVFEQTHSENGRDYDAAVRAALTVTANNLISAMYSRVENEESKRSLQDAVAYDYHVTTSLNESFAMISPLIAEQRIVALFVRVL